jgi:steroid 5-alpha reductase family enzyme
MCPFYCYSELLINGLIGSFFLFSALWIVQVIRKDAGVVDIGWTLGVGAMAVYAAINGTGWMPRRIILGTMVAIWSLRLILYILKDRLIQAKEEDGRYQRLRKHWGRDANSYFFFFFTCQSLLVILFTLPFLPATSNQTPHLTAFDILAIAVWMIAMGGEWMADAQLARFRRNPAHKGEVCNTGLWRYSRHPNYFFEWMHWWSYLFLAIGAPDALLALTGPLAIYLFLMRISGIPHVEKQALSTRGEAYRTYQQQTNLFFPGPPRPISKQETNHD